MLAEKPLACSLAETAEGALPSLRAMTGETGWTSRVGVLDGTYAVMVGRVDGPGIIRFQSNLAGRELPHCSAIGKALLSHLPDDGVRTIVARTGLPARTATTITDVDELLRELERVREQGSRSTTRRTATASSASAPRSSTTGGPASRRSASPGLLTLPAGGIDNLPGRGPLRRRDLGQMGAVPASS